MQALPLFRIITPNQWAITTPTNRMSAADEIPTKPRRKKKSVVAVHKSSKNEEGINSESSHKIYSGQFNSKKRIKQRSNEVNELSVDKRDRHYSNDRDDSNLDLIVSADKSVHKIRKKSLIEANERLYAENQQLNEKLNENEEFFNKKIGKFKEKVGVVEKYNEDLANENNIIKIQYQDLLVNFEECKNQLENSKHCRSCEELKNTLEKCSAENDLLKASNRQLVEDIDMLKNVVYR